MKTTLLIDGDLIAYQIAAACETSIDWGEDMWTLHSDAKEACEILECKLRFWEAELGAQETLVALSDKVNWRKQVLPSYKAHRAGSRKPIAFLGILDHLRYMWGAKSRPTLEADDLLGLMATSKQLKGRKIIVSADKDMQSVPGWLWNPDKDPEPREITVEQADYYHLYQTLCGDTADGYGGCPGVGDVGARRLLDKDPSWGTVVAAYDKAGLGEGEALIQARVARILRTGEYDTKKNRVKLWSPPKAPKTHTQKG